MPKETKTAWFLRLPAESDVYINAKPLRLKSGTSVNLRDGDVVVAIVRFKPKVKR